MDNIEDDMPPLISLPAQSSASTSTFLARDLLLLIIYGTSQQMGNGQVSSIIEAYVTGSGLLSPLLTGLKCCDFCINPALADGACLSTRKDLSSMFCQATIQPHRSQHALPPCTSQTPYQIAFSVQHNMVCSQ